MIWQLLKLDWINPGFSCFSLYLYTLLSIASFCTFLISLALLSFSFKILSISNSCSFDLWISFCWNYFFFYSITFPFITYNFSNCLFSLLISFILLSSLLIILRSSSLSYGRFTYNANTLSFSALYISYFIFYVFYKLVSFIIYSTGLFILLI